MNDQQDIVYYLPRSTARLLTSERVKRCKNLGLILDKYPERVAIEKGDGRGQWLREIEPVSHIDAALSENVYQRWLAMTTAMQARHFSAAIDWRMVVGLGGETVLETDLTLHYLYGTPYIPGSALKGLTRAYVTGEVEGYKSDKIEDDTEDIKRIFGSQKRAGTVIFFDAMPINGKTAFALDIMNPHYPEYYAGNKPPTNDQSPVPVTFLTVTDTSFMFALALRDSRYPDDIKLAQEWLQTALQKYGIGGKTSAGYGYFRLSDKTEPVAPTQPPQITSTPSQPIRTDLPKFREGQEIRGVVFTPDDRLRQLAPPGTTAFLRYESFPTRDLFLAVSDEAARTWRSGETRFCLLRRQEERNGCVVLLCQPRPKK
jgi:CRISPR type III-B/RAMP module RAMP protein Cmr6